MYAVLVDFVMAAMALRHLRRRQRPFWVATTSFSSPDVVAVSGYTTSYILAVVRVVVMSTPYAGWSLLWSEKGVYGLW